MDAAATTREQLHRSPGSVADLNDGLPNRWWIFGLVSLALLMTSIDQTIVATALGTIQDDLHTRINWASWTITIYSLGRIIVLPLAGRLSDQYGRRTVFLLSTALFTVSSLACGLADNIALLIVLRGVQAIGGGAFMPSATGLVADHFGRNRDRAVGMFSSILPIGGIIGPTLGGIFVTYWSWRGIFLVNVPIGIAIVALGFKIIPHGGQTARTRTDPVGITLLGVTLLSAMFGIAYLGDASLTSVSFIGPELLAIVTGVFFVRHASRHPAPVLPSRLLYGRGFGIVNAVNFLYGSAALGFSALVPIYATERFGIKTLDSGTLLSARSIGMIALAAVAAMGLRRTGYRWPMSVGFAVTAVGLLAMAVHPSAFSPYLWLAIAACVTGLGMGVATPASNNAALQLAPEHVATIAGLRAMFRQMGAITAVSVTTAIVAQGNDPGLEQARIFCIFAAVMVCTIPLIWRIPEHRGRW